MTIMAAGALTLVYVLAVGSAAPWDLAAGAAASAAALLVFGPFVRAELPAPAGRTGRIALHLLMLGPAMVWELALGTVRVLRAARRRDAEPGLVDVPIAERSDAALALAGLLASLAPDEYLVEIDRRRGVMVFHAVDARGADEIRRRHQALYERYVKPLVP